jgi:hypothetical protein
MGERSLSAPLAALQSLVTDAIRRPSPLCEDDPLAHDVEELVAPSARGMHALERLEVYRDQFWVRHLLSLQDDYPTLVWALGRDTFRRLATEYLQACPPRTWNLQKLGADLPHYVASRAPWHGDAIARDAARLDWAFMHAFDAPDAPPFDRRVLATAPESSWPGARLAFHPSLRALALEHSLHELRESIKRGHPCPRPAPQVTRIVVWRDHACFLHAAALEPLAFELLVALERGALLGGACEELARSHREADPLGLAPRVGAWFEQWTASGWVSAVRFEP